MRVPASSTGRTGDPRASEAARGAAGAFRQMPLRVGCSDPAGIPFAVLLRWPPLLDNPFGKSSRALVSRYRFARRSTLSSVLGLNLFDDADEALTLFGKHRHHLDDLSQDVCALRASLDRLGGEPLSIRRVGYEPADQ